MVSDCARRAERRAGRSLEIKCQRLRGRRRGIQLGLEKFVGKAMQSRSLRPAQKSVDNELPYLLPRLAICREVVYRQR